MKYEIFIGLNSDIIKIRTDVFIKEQSFNDEFDEVYFDEYCEHVRMVKKL